MTKKHKEIYSQVNNYKGLKICIMNFMVENIIQNKKMNLIYQIQKIKIKILVFKLYNIKKKENVQVQQHRF